MIIERNDKHVVKNFRNYSENNVYSCVVLNWDCWLGYYDLVNRWVIILNDRNSKRENQRVKKKEYINIRVPKFIRLRSFTKVLYWLTYELLWKLKKFKFYCYNERAKRMNVRTKNWVFIFWTDLGILILVQSVIMFDFC